VSVDGNVVTELGDRLAAVASTMQSEADELAARRLHSDVHLYDVEMGLRHRAAELNDCLKTLPWPSI